MSASRHLLLQPSGGVGLHGHLPFAGSSNNCTVRQIRAEEFAKPTWKIRLVCKKWIARGDAALATAADIAKPPPENDRRSLFITNPFFSEMLVICAEFVKQK
jgi:hypothetical protein